MSSREPFTPPCLSPGHFFVGHRRLQPRERAPACSCSLLPALARWEALPALVPAGIAPVVAFSCIVSSESDAEILLLFHLK